MDWFLYDKDFRHEGVKLYRSHFEDIADHLLIFYVGKARTV